MLAAISSATVTSATSTSSLRAAERSSAVTRCQLGGFPSIALHPLEKEGAHIGERDETGSAAQCDRPCERSRPWPACSPLPAIGRNGPTGVVAFPQQIKADSSEQIDSCPTVI
jgi:hypothetical protein